MLKEILLLFLAISIGVNGNYCTDQCQFSLSFNDQYQVPENCPKAYGHTFLLCHSDLQIDYIAKTVDINLYAEENTLTDSEKYRMDLNSSFDQPDEQMTGSLQYSCAVLDDCARDFTAKVYKMLLNHQAILYTMKNNLYNVGSSNVQQCYDLDNKTVDCKNGLCRAELGSSLKPDDPFTPIPYYKTYCDYYPPEDPFHNKTGLMSIYPYGYSTVFGVFNTLHYVCNKNLCNNYESIQSIQTLVEDFNNFDKPSPSPSTATTISSALKLILTLSLIKCFLINSYLK